MNRLEKLKKKIIEEAADNPGKFFAVEEIRKNGFERKKCKKCGKYFWSIEDREVCGDTDCVGGYKFINDPPTEKSFDVVSAWQEFSKFMEERGYEPIGRYPVVARWRNDTEFVRASIYDFQPYVVSGEVEPPANPLVVPQFSLRFNDIDNVGVTGSHYTGFVMDGQHAFKSPDEYEQDKYFRDMLDWIVEGMGIPKDKVILHEDSWGGGGNLGACMEFFVDGLELFNQVYMFYEIDDSERGYSELDTKVLDMGMGHERIVWITRGTETSYEANMPKAVKKLYERTGVEPDKELWAKFLPYAGLLNFDEVGDLEEVWREISQEIGVEMGKLKEEVIPAAALYSIADHTRALLVAFADGALPSNTGEKHSLRVIARRAMDFIDKHGWNVDLKEVMEWHAQELEGIFPELKENLDEAQKIMEHEKRKYKEMKERAERKVKSLGEDELDQEKMVELYVSEGISPEMLNRLGFEVEIPSNFYAKVNERQVEEKKTVGEEEEFDIADTKETELIYRKDERKKSFEAKVRKIIEMNGKKFVVLDRTCFYPESGGQSYDKGNIDGFDVKRVVKKNGVVLHEMDEVDFGEGDSVTGKIDWDRRKQMMQHHSAAHLINGAAQKVLGKHVWQAGAKKTEERARLDITHFDNLSDEEIKKIGEEARKWIDRKLEVKKLDMKKVEAEERYGFRIYQGGVPPGNELRIVIVGEERDVEACGGTHVDNTEEIEDITITSTSKVQDGVIRIEFKAGGAARNYRKHKKRIRDELGKMIDVEEYRLGDICDIYGVGLEELPKVVKRFVSEWSERKERADNLREELGEGSIKDGRPKDPKELFESWKEMGKEINRLEERLGEKVINEVLDSEKDFIRRDVDIGDIGILIKTVKKIVEEGGEKAVMLVGRDGAIASKGGKSDHEIKNEVERVANVVKESDGIVKGFDLKD